MTILGHIIFPVGLLILLCSHRGRKPRAAFITGLALTVVGFFLAKTLPYLVDRAARKQTVFSEVEQTPATMCLTGDDLVDRMCISHSETGIIYIWDTAPTPDTMTRVLPETTP